MKLPLKLRPYSVVFHAVLVAALLTGMGYALFPTKTAGDTIIRLTAFFCLLFVQSFLWIMREKSVTELKQELKDCKEQIAFRAKNGYEKGDNNV